jgi:hypothetical protein
MKLSDWADKQGIAYLTAYRWFKSGKLPVKAYQSESGTIIVQDDAENLSETSMSSNSDTNNNAMTLFLKKTVEFSKSNSTIEDFAAYILSNFSLKVNTASEGPRYSRNKPKSEDVQKHFKQFIPKVEKPKPSMFISDQDSIDDLIAKSNNLTKKELIEEINKIGGNTPVIKNEEVSDSLDELPEVQDLYKDLSVAFNASGTLPMVTNSVTTYDSLSHEGVFSRTTITPQNYTTPTANPTLGSVDIRSTIAISNDGSVSITNPNSVILGEPSGSATIMFNGTGPTGSFKPTSKELEMVKSFTETQPKRRGRKAKGSK